MKKVKVKVTMKRPAIKRLHSAQASSAEIVAEKMLEETRPNIPVRTGKLRDNTYVDSSNVKKGKVSIVSDVDYAQRIYFNPESEKSGWWEDWIRGTKKSKPVKLFKQIYKDAVKRWVK